MTPAVEQIVERIGAHRGSAILRASDPDVVAPAMEAAIRAGFRVIEFTLTTPNALSHIRDFSAREDLLVGAGTVLTVDEARAAVDAGARFIVSPVVDEEVIAEATRLDAAAMPGAHTPTELLRAHRAGAPLQKLFPAIAEGPRGVKAILGPLPFLRIVPTNGVHRNNVAAYLKAGAFATGFVAPLFDPNDMAQGRFDRIEERGRAILDAMP